MSIRISKDAKTALLFGATGLVGRFILKNLLASSIYSKVIVFTRKSTGVEHEKMTEHIIDFDDLTKYRSLIIGDDLFYSIGTTIKKAGDKKNFVKIDYTYGIIIARLAYQNEVNQFLIVSAIGADQYSLFFYNKVKGQLEFDLKKLNFWATHIFQPSVMLGFRNENRIKETVAANIGLGIKHILGDKLGKYQPIEGKKVADAMILVAQGLDKGIHIYPSHIIEQLLKKEENGMIQH